MTIATAGQRVTVLKKPVRILQESRSQPGTLKWPGATLSPGQTVELLGQKTMKLNGEDHEVFELGNIEERYIRVGDLHGDDSSDR